jgi:hypothetical protein
MMTNEQKDKTMDTMTATKKEYRARVRCNSCFKFSWVTIEAGYDVNHNACGKCGQLNAVVYKLITIKPEHAGPRCAGPCQNSKSGECECSCGGKNHGLHA